MSAKKISIINMKGGVGKTTLSVHLARFLAQDHNQKVLLIDLDPQANASVMVIPEISLGKHYKDKDKKTIYGLFFNWMKQFGPFQKPKSSINLKDYLYRSFPNKNDYSNHPSNSQGYLDIIPSHLSLSSLLRGASVGPYELDRFFKEFELSKKYDYILIDCAPTYSILTTLALNATDSVLIPMKAEPFGIYGTQLMQKVLEEHEYDFGKKIKILGIVYTMWPIETERQKTEEESERKITEKWESIGLSKDAVFRGIKQAANYKIASEAINKKHDYYLRFIKRTGLKEIRVQEFEKFVQWFVEQADNMEEKDAQPKADLDSK